MTAIRQWLDGLGLGQYAETFETEEIELSDLRDLVESDLEKLGLPMGPRKRLLRAIQAGIAEPAGPTALRPVPNPKYAPAPLAEKILKARSSIQGERKQVTILFADLEGSTVLVQHMDPEAVSSLLDPIQKMMMDAVHAYEGTVNEILGDGIMAIFGAPIAHEDHALRACRAALDMQDAIRRWAPQIIAGSPARSIKLRVGLNSGEVVVRAINNDLTMSYSAMGMTTHLAARMEQTAAPGTIRLTNDCLRHLRGLVEVRARGKIKVKGVAQAVPVYELQGLGKAQTRLEAASVAGLTRFIGREQELRVLQERFVEVDAGQGQVVSIIGDPGIGKSRLLMEFRQRIGDRASWVEGHSVSFGQSMAFHPVIDSMRRNFRMEERDPVEVMRAKVGAGIARIGPGLESTLPYVFYMLGIAEAGDPVQHMDPQIRRAETFDALRQLLLRAAERKPQVLVYEDLHWSDHATREFLTFLIDSIPRSRVLVLLTLRPGHDLALAERTYATRLVLRNLSAEEAAEMTAAVLTSADLPAELHALVQRKAEGNPFFVEELIKSLGETGAILRRGERWALARPLDQIAVPDTIQDVLAARIDHLEEEPRQALQLAAVIGREFTQRLLDRIAGIRRGTAAILRELQAIELIYETALFPELAYMFKHALTQDVAYRSLLTERRRELHRRIGEAIEELYADRLAEHYAVLAHHFARGEDWTGAAAYFEKAADRAAAAFAIHEALALYDQAIEALDRDGGGEAASRKEGALRTRKGDLCMSLSDFERAHAEHANAARIGCQLADGMREGSALAGMALSSVLAHKFEQCLEEAERARTLGRAIGSAEILAAAELATGFVQVVTGHLEQAETSLRAAHEISRSQRQAFHHAHTSMLLGLLENWRGNYEIAIARSEEAIEVARGHHHAFALMQGQFAHGLARTGRGDYDDALRAFTEGLALAEKLGSGFFRSRFLNSLGWIHAECGDLDRAIQLNERGLGVSRERGDPETIANCELNLGDAFHAKGDLALSRELFAGVHDLVRRPSTIDWMKWRYSQHLFASLGEAWLASDDWAKAEDFCDQGLDLATRTDSKKYLARGWRLKGRIAVARLHWGEAEEALRRALGYAQPIGNPTQLWKTHVALGELYRETRRPDPSRASFAAARAVMDSIGGSLRTPELKEAFKGSPVFCSIFEQVWAD